MVNFAGSIFRKHVSRETAIERLKRRSAKPRQLGDIGRDPARLDLSMTPASAALYWTVKKGRVGVRAALCFTLLSSLLVVNVVAAWARPLIGKTL
jgi:hypothetical protein